MLSRHKASSVPRPDGEVTGEERARNEPNHMIHEDVGEEDGVNTCVSHQWPQRGDSCLECASVSQHTRWKPHANMGMTNVLRPMTASPPTPQTPVFQQILSIMLFLKRHKSIFPFWLINAGLTPILQATSLHPCPSAPIGNMQESVPAGHTAIAVGSFSSQFPRFY